MKVLGRVKIIERDKYTEEILNIVESKNLVVARGKTEFMRRISQGFSRDACGNADQYTYKRAVLGLALGPYSFTLSGDTITSATEQAYPTDGSLDPAETDIHLINIAFLKQGSSNFDSGNNRMYWYFRVFEYEFNEVNVVWANADPDTNQPSNNPQHSLRPLRANPGVLNPTVRELGLYDPMYLQNFAFPWETSPSDKLNPNTGTLINRIKLTTPVTKTPDKIWDIYIFIQIV